MWSDLGGSFRDNDCLLYKQLWAGYLAGKECGEQEPFLVVERGLEQDEAVYRIYLRPNPSWGTPKRESSLVCCLPVAVLANPRRWRNRRVMNRFGLEPIENAYEGWHEGDFEGSQVYRPNGPYMIYENDFFRFKVRRFS